MRLKHGSAERAVQRAENFKERNTVGECEETKYRNAASKGSAESLDVGCLFSKASTYAIPKV